MHVHLFSIMAMARWEDDNVHTPRVRFYGCVARCAAQMVCGARLTNTCAPLATISLLLLGLAVALVAGQVHLVSLWRACQLAQHNLFGRVLCFRQLRL